MLRSWRDTRSARITPADDRPSPHRGARVVARAGLVIVLALSLALSLSLAACEEAEPPRAPTPSVATQPRATDHLLSLLREQLVSRDAAAVQQAMVCEMGRLERMLGATDARQRIDDVLDSVYTTADEWAAAQRLEKQNEGRSFAMSGGVCDSLDAVAQRAVPLVREPAAARASR